MILLGEPFRASSSEGFSFARADNQWTPIATEIRSMIPTMLQHRLAPPPRETLSLNRCVAHCSLSECGLLIFLSLRSKLSGAFLLAARLEARVNCGELWRKITDDYMLEATTSSEKTQT